jgi:hypothetical protein
MTIMCDRCSKVYRTEQIGSVAGKNLCIACLVLLVNIMYTETSYLVKIMFEAKLIK